jgi:ribosome-associated heat shock protein Hsp15
MEGAALRLDKFLYFVRLAKSRGKAQALVLGGNPRIDGRVVISPHAALTTGSTITIVIDQRVRVLRVVALPARRGPTAEARSCYDDLSHPQVIDADAP